MPIMSFLSFPLSSIRRSIKDIDDSYRNPWDIFAELAQNSVDAIRRMRLDHQEEGHIKIVVDKRDRSIVFEDNGCGISGEDLPRLLNLFSTGKANEPDSVGEKGVGLKFVMFQSSFFEIVTSDGVSTSKVTIEGARTWKKSDTNEELLLDFESIPLTPHGTKITVRNIQIDTDDDDDENTKSIFDLNYNQLRYILRTKTYLGNDSSIWEDNLHPISITLDFVDENGILTTEALENKYALPFEGLPNDSIYNIETFEEWLSQHVNASESAKRAKLQGKVLYLQGQYVHNSNRTIKYWACFLPTRRDWKTVNDNLNLIPEDVDYLDDREWREENAFCLYSSGIYTSTKGMPTGIVIEPPSSGNAGYWSNFFILFQDDNLTFDIGRKSIHGKIKSIYQQYARQIFNRIVGYVTRYTSAVPLNPTGSFDRYSARSNVEQLADLGISSIPFIKTPADQEASVSAVFFELIGQGLLSDIKPIYLGYRNKYDMYAFVTSPCTNEEGFKFFEFKSHLRNLILDFSDARKVFDEIDYVICWDVSDTDIQDLDEFGIGCEEYANSTLHPGDYSMSVTHIMTIPNCNPIYVIDLKKIIESLDRSE